METYNYNDFAAAGIDVKFMQDNQSASKRGVLRGWDQIKLGVHNNKVLIVVSGVDKLDIVQKAFSNR